jgi:hypothetical protein
MLLPEGDDATTMDTVRPAIQFMHRRQNGEVNTHADEYIGLESLFNLLQSRNDEYRQGRGGDIGMCWNYPTCDAKIHPQEVQAILTRLDTNAADYPEVTAENKARYRQIYDVYRNNYNRKYQRGGRATRRGRKQQHGGDGETGATPFFVEATDAQCMLPRRGNAAVPGAAAPRKRKTLRKKRTRRV